MDNVGQVDTYVQDNLKRNFTVNVLDGTFFMLGMSFSSVVTVMPLFVSQLSSSPLLISLIPAIQNVGWFLPASSPPNTSRSCRARNPSSC